MKEKAKLILINILFPYSSFTHAVEESSRAANALQLLRYANGKEKYDLR